MLLLCRQRRVLDIDIRWKDRSHPFYLIKYLFGCSFISESIDSLKQVIRAKMAEYCHFSYLTD